MLRTAGFPLIICPSVALAHLLVAGALPPASTLAAVALVAALAGLLAGRRAHRGAARLTGQLTIAQLLGHLTVYLALGEPSNGCLPAMGRGAEAGVRLAILYRQPSCASGDYAAGLLVSTAAALLLVAVAVVLWQILVAACGSALLQMGEHAWTTVVSLLAAAVLVLQDFAALVITGAAVQPPAGAWQPARPSVTVRALLLRGPPALSA